MFNLIFTICPADNQTEVMEAAKATGARGATILSARGTGHKEATTFFGLSLDRPQEAMVMLVEKGHSADIMQAIYDAGNMKEPGNGICFSLPVDHAMGLESQLCVLPDDDNDDDDQ